MAFVGFRHGHIHGLMDAARKHNDISIVACCEEDAITRKELAANHPDVTLTHDHFATMLDEIDFDILAVGDYYAKRGRLVIEALKRGKHVISDKPLCTNLEELEEIEALVRKNNLHLGLQLDLRSLGTYTTMRRVVQEGKIGEVHSVVFLGLHPLDPNNRPSWYFKDGCHGGTINDLAIHGVDIVEWITGQTVAETITARAWNARCTKNPNFQDGAQLILRLDNDGGVMGDVSYFAPEQGAWTAPPYWRLTIHGENGLLEGGLNTKSLYLLDGNSGKTKSVKPDDGIPVAYLADFLAQLNGQAKESSLTTETVLRVSRTCLKAQQMADNNF